MGANTCPAEPPVFPAIVIFLNSHIQSVTQFPYLALGSPLNLDPLAWDRNLRASWLCESETRSYHTPILSVPCDPLEQPLSVCWGWWGTDSENKVWSRTLRADGTWNEEVSGAPGARYDGAGSHRPGAEAGG